MESINLLQCFGFHVKVSFFHFQTSHWWFECYFTMPPNKWGKSKKSKTAHSKADWKRLTYNRFLLQENEYIVKFRDNYLQLTAKQVSMNLYKPLSWVLGGTQLCCSLSQKEMQLDLGLTRGSSRPGTQTCLFASWPAWPPPRGWLWPRRTWRGWWGGCRTWWARAGRLGSAGKPLWRRTWDAPSPPGRMAVACTAATGGCPEGNGGAERPQRNLAMAPGRKMGKVVNLTLPQLRSTVDIQCISLECAIVSLKSEQSSRLSEFSFCTSMLIFIFKWVKKETTYTSTKTKVTVKKHKDGKKIEMSKTKTFVTFHSNGTFEISNGLLFLIGTRWHDNNTQKL